MEGQSLGIVKEEIEETRICFTPETVKRAATELGMNVWVERGFGLSVGISDLAFEEAGAHIADRSEVIAHSELLPFINPFYQGEKLDSEKSMMGIVNPLYHPGALEVYREKPVSLYSLDMLPRTTRAQPMDVLSSMSSIAGYKAVIKAADLYGSVFPMFTTAAGTLKPANVLVLGAGVAGLQAIATARRLGAVVEAFDVRSAAAEEVESLGAKFVYLEGSREDQGAGGYAIRQTPEYERLQKEAIHQKAKWADIVVCTANIPGKRAPLLLHSETVDEMKPGSVIVDLASAQGGNCECSQDGRMVLYRDKTIMGASYLARQVSRASSQMLAINYYSFLRHFANNRENPDDEIINACRIVSRGEIVHPKLVMN